MKHALIALAAALSLGGVAQAQDQTPRQRVPMSAEAMWGLARVGDPVITPDGRGAIVAISRFTLSDDSRTSDLFLYPTDGSAPRQLTADRAGESEVVVSPDGRSIAFVARRTGDEQGQLYVLPLDGGEARRITTVPVGVRLPRWLPDGSGLVFLARVWEDLDTWEAQGARLKERATSPMTARVWDRPQVTDWDQFVDDGAWHLYRVPATGGDVTAITRGSGRSVALSVQGGMPYDISPDGREVAFESDTDTTGVRPNIDIYTIPLAGGTPTNLTTDNVNGDGGPAYSPDGRYLAFGRQVLYGFYGENVRLMLRDRRAGTTRWLTEGWDRSASGLVWTPDSRSLYGSIDDAGTRRVYRFDISGGAPRLITGLPQGQQPDLSGLEIAGRNPVLVGTRQSFSEPPTLVRIDPRTGATTQLSKVNDEALAGFDFGTVESVTYEGANGVPIQMWVAYPPGFDRTKKYPLYLLLHGGPHNGITNAWTWRWNAHVFAGWGYVTGWHNFHGSSGFGQAFTDSINPDRITLPYQDTIKAAEWFAGQPWIDTNRMTAGGGSYGGFLASTLLGREHPFRALVAHAAVYNNFTQMAADYSGEQDRHFEFWDRPEEFLRYSPHMSAGNFATPTLVIHGQLDYRVPVTHGIELFHTLQRRGVPSRLVYYPNENHWILKPQNSVFWYGQVREWIGRYAPAGANTPAVPAFTLPAAATAAARGG